MADSGQNEGGFEAYLDQQIGGLRSDFEIGEKISGTVTAIDRSAVFVDIGARSEGILEREALLNDEGELSVKVGDPIDAYFVGSKRGEMKLALTFGGSAADDSLWEASQSGIPVAGRVVSERTGGYEVNVGSKSGFCPYSQIDIHRRDPAAYLGEKFNFKVIEYDEFGGNLVLSRRQLLEQEREQLKESLKETLQPGDLVDGKVSKVMPFGAFVALGGVEGLIPISELAWGRTENVEDVVSEGQAVTVMVREIDWARERISLSLRRAQGDPWDDVKLRYGAGSSYPGLVTKLMPFGAFVQLEPGIEGLVHISKLGTGRRVGHPSEVVAEGQAVEVTVESIDLDQHRISLSMARAGGIEADMASTGNAEDVVVGNEVKGTVEGIKLFGLFVRLPDGRTGLLHISKIDVKLGRDPERALAVAYPQGSEIAVVVEAIEGDRLALTTPAQWAGDHEGFDPKAFLENKGDDLGSLGDAFGGLEL